MVDMLFISLERNAPTPLLYLTIYSLSRMDVCIMMRRLNKTTPRNKLDGEEAPEHDDEVE
jgi:hypothetical protein